MAALASSALAVLVVVACYSPTEVRLQITTDRACVAQKSADDATPDVGSPPKRVRTLIEVGASPGDLSGEETETGDCTTPAPGNGDIGSLVFVPRGDRSARATVQVSMTIDGSNPHDCIQKGIVAKQCIVTRRTFSFIEHTARTVPIRLYTACEGKTCSPDEGCDELGVCRFADIDLAQDAGRSTDASDAADRRDVSVPLDAGSDVIPKVSCTPNAQHIVTALPEGDAPGVLLENSSDLFWIAGSTVKTISKSGGQARPLITSSTWPSIEAIAVDDKVLWVATASLVQSYDLTKKTLGPALNLTDVTSIAIQPAADGGTTYFVSRAPGMSGPKLRSLPPGGTSLVPVPSSPDGDHVFVDGKFAFTVDDAAQMIHAYDLSVPAVPTAVATGGAFRGGAASVTTLFFATVDGDGAGTMKRLAGTGGLPLYPAGNPGALAVDTLYVYYADQGKVGPVPNPAALMRGAKTASATPLTPVATGFAQIYGLALERRNIADDGCAYFFASRAAGPLLATNLYVYPKNPGP